MDVLGGLFEIHEKANQRHNLDIIFEILVIFDLKFHHVELIEISFDFGELVIMDDLILEVIEEIGMPYVGCLDLTHKGPEDVSLPYYPY